MDRRDHRYITSERGLDGLLDLVIKEAHAMTDIKAWGREVSGGYMGSMREFTSGATRSSEEGKYDYEGFLSPAVLERYARFMHKHRRQVDGEFRESDNWQKGMPRSAYIKSLWRHFMDVWTWHRRGVYLTEAMEDALCAVMFNTMGYLHEFIKEHRNVETPDPSA